MKALSALLLVAAVAFPQCFKLAEVNAEKPEGQLLQQIGQEQDQAKRVALMEKFAADYPKHEATGWIYEQMQAAYIKANAPDKIIDMAGRIVPMSPECVEAALQGLKAAEARKDFDLIKKWSAQTSQMALKVVASPKPKEEDEVETWKQRVDYARQVNTYTEYSLYAAAIQTTDPLKRIDLMETLEKRNPKSEYLAQSYGGLFMAYRQAKADDKAMALAERIIASGQPDEDMLLFVAGNYFQQKTNPEKVHELSARVAELMKNKPKPQGVADADWNNRKNIMAGTALFMSGTLYHSQSRFAQADKLLREALPFIEGNLAMKTEALYDLGFANYKLEKPQDAVNFYRACGAIKSRFQALANKNVQAIRSEYTGIK